MEFLPKKLVKEWSWRVDNGMPDYRNPLHLVELKNLLIERRFPYHFIDGLLGNLRGEKEIVTEARSSRTEDLHEIFFALAYAALEGGKKSDYDNIDSYKSFSKLLNSLSGINLKPKMLKVAGKWNKEYAMFDTKGKKKKLGEKDLDKLSDAMGLAKRVKSYIDTNVDGSFKKVGRVFGAGKKGTKVIADAIIWLDTDKVQCSLKYGVGQFNSLSVPQMVKKLYGKELKDGLLKDMYADGYKSTIDEVFAYFLDPIMENFKDWPLTDKFTEEDVEMIKSSNLTAGSSWGTYLKAKVDVKKAMSHAYNHPENFNARETHTYHKRLLLNTQIENFMGASASGGNMGPVVDNLEEALIYILRAEPDTTYLYAASGGKKFAMVPSQEQIKGKTYKMEPHFKMQGTDQYTGQDYQISKWADYKFDVDVYVDNIKAFTFDILWRFAGAGGQWATDLNHKGSKIVFHSGFAKAFGLPNIPPMETDGTI